MERPEFDTGQIKEAAGRMKEFLEELLNTGLARTSPDVLDYLERPAISCKRLPPNILRMFAKGYAAISSDSSCLMPPACGFSDFSASMSAAGFSADLDDDYLIGISNKGIVKRAYKDKEEGDYEVLCAGGEAEVRVGKETVCFPVVHTL